MLIFFLIFDLAKGGSAPLVPPWLRPWTG